MSAPLTPEFLETVLDRLAASDWSRRHLTLMVSSEGHGIITGADQHFAALRRLSATDLGDVGLPPRFCVPGEFDE